MSVALFNRCWARVILETLSRHGVEHICLAPGSRSTPLTMEAVHLRDQQRATLHTHFDERGLGFLALGLAKAEQKPVVIIVTSGTAGANLYPAIIEAKQSHEKLIVLTADRPFDLIGCGANQAIEQADLFGHYPVKTLNLPTPSDYYSASWLARQIDEACYQQQYHSGVVHCNVPFAEPLYDVDESAVDDHMWLRPIQDWLRQRYTWIRHGEQQQQIVIHEQWDHWRTKRGVVVVGRLPLAQSIGITQWAQTMGWILISDVQSGLNSPLPYADIWLANHIVQEKLLQAEIVIQFGSHIISKRTQQFLQQYQGEYWIVDSTGDNIDPHHHRAVYFPFKVNHWLRAHPPLRRREWLLEPLALSKFCMTFINQQLGNNLNEASLAFYIEKILPNNGALFLGNSLFIRLVDALGKLPEDYSVYCNRGASGIDGLLATAAGIALSIKQPLVAMIGDLSALYDLNSLALFKQVHQPTLLFVINNNGGAIFDMLPVDQQVKDDFYRLPHHIKFTQAAALFGLNYAQPYTWADLMNVLKKAYSRKETTLIEIKTPPHEGSQIYRTLLEQIAGAQIGG